MNYAEFYNVQLRCISSVVPEDEIRIDDELVYYNNDPKKIARIKKMTGLDKRRIAPTGVTASDLCIQAAQRLFVSADCDSSTIDALIFVTQTPDYPAPATAFLQQTALGLSQNCAVFDVNLGCSGYVYGLWLASCMIESGARRRVLLLVGDAECRYRNVANRITAPIFGDAGSASLLEYKKNAAPLSFSLGSDGRGYEAIIRPGGGGRIPHLSEQDIEGYMTEVRDQGGNPWSVGGFGNTWMNGMTVFDFTMSVVPGHIRQHLTHRHLVPDNIDYLVLHQANRQIVENIAADAGFQPAQAPWETMNKFGNQAGASIPCVICDQLKAICDAGEKLRLMLCGYGIGFSWGSCIGDFSGLHCCGIHNFVPPPHITTRQEHIKYWHCTFAGDNNG